MVDLKMLDDIKKEAINDNVPIIEDDSLNFITDYIVSKGIKKILEIGTAVGYSSIVMALSSPSVYITTIERDKTRYLKAVENIKKMNLENRINLIFGDALDMELDNTFDLIFIDAAKSQSIKFFTKYEKCLDICGTIITDNLSFHGMTNKKPEEIASRNVRGLVRKINDYKKFLKDNKNYKTKFYDLGDGISVSERRHVNGNIGCE